MKATITAEIPVLLRMLVISTAAAAPWPQNYLAPVDLSAA
jgi:hypothetical protein